MCFCSLILKKYRSRLACHKSQRQEAIKLITGAYIKQQKYFRTQKKKHEKCL